MDESSIYFVWLIVIHFPEKMISYVYVFVEIITITVQIHSYHNHCKSNKHRINHFAPPGFRISNAKHKITDPDNISDKQQAAAIKKHRQKEQGVNCFHTILRKYKLLYFPHSRHLHEFRRCIHSFPMFHSTIAKTDPVQDSSLTYLRLFTNMPTTVKIIIVTIQYSTPGWW